MLTHHACLMVSIWTTFRTGCLRGAKAIGLLTSEAYSGESLRVPGQRRAGRAKLRSAPRSNLLSRGERLIANLAKTS
jgi:hypothetical protein